MFLRIYARERELERQREGVLFFGFLARVSLGARVCVCKPARGPGGRGGSSSEELKPAARVAVLEEKGVGVTEAPRGLVVDQRPQGVPEEGREGPRAQVITFQRLHDLELFGQVGAAAEGHAREAGELGEAGVRAQGHDALGGREGAPAEQLALLRQLPELPLLLLLEELPLRQVVFPAEGQPPQRRLQVMGARGAWCPRLLTLLVVSGKRGDRVSGGHQQGALYNTQGGLNAEWASVAAGVSKETKASC